MGIWIRRGRWRTHGEVALAFGPCAAKIRVLNGFAVFRRAERAIHESRLNSGIVVVFKVEAAARDIHIRPLAPEFRSVNARKKSVAKIKRSSWALLSVCCVSNNQGDSYSCPYHFIHVAIIRPGDLDWLVPPREEALGRYSLVEPVDRLLERSFVPCLDIWD
jgi:hypothetical protein